MSEWPPLHWSRGQIGSEEDKEKGRQKEVKGTIDSNGHPRPLTEGVGFLYRKYISSCSLIDSGLIDFRGHQLGCLPSIWGFGKSGVRVAVAPIMVSISDNLPLTGFR